MSGGPVFGKKVRPLKIEPLWVRVERNRLKLVVFISSFAVLWGLLVVVAAGVPLAAVVVMAGYLAASEGYPLGSAIAEFGVSHFWQAVAVLGSIGAAAALAYVFWTLAQPLRKQLAALGVSRLDIAEHPETRRAMREMAIAAGFADRTPELFVLDSSSVNAFLIARGDERAFCIVTSGLLRRFEPVYQRAVFANLLARLRAGDIQWATAVSALMMPLWRWREFDLSAKSLTVPLKIEFTAGDPTRPRYISLRASAEEKQGFWAHLFFASPLLGVFAWVAYVAAILASEFVALGHRRSHLLTSEAADAEGMLLLKDPVVMLTALRRAIEADNRVRLALPLYAQLFYIWAGDDVGDEHDPEWERLNRLREVVGVDGLSDAEEALVGHGAPEGQAPVAPHMEFAGEPIAARPRIIVPVGPVTGLAAAAATLITLVAGSRLFSFANIDRPLGDSSQAAWSEFGLQLASLETRLLIVTVLAVLWGSLLAGRRWSGWLMAAVPGGVAAGSFVLSRSVAMGQQGAWLPGAWFAVLGGGCILAAVAGAVGGAVLRRRIEG